MPIKDVVPHNLVTSATTGNLIAMGDVEGAVNGKNRDIKEFYNKRSSNDEDKDGGNGQAHKKAAAAKSRSQTGTGGPNSKRT